MIYTIFSDKILYYTRGAEMVMKSFFMAILFTLVIKGVSYILCPKFVKNCSQKLMETPDIQLVTFGWILVLVSFAAWVGYVRHMDY